jgi:radical SAM protein with 4Fe4S-binding SPASM domain
MREHCMVGVTNLSITADGNIHTCFKMPPLGNVRQTTPQAVWDSKEARELRKKIKCCDIHCSPGNFVYRRSLLSEALRYLRYG